MPVALPCHGRHTIRCVIELDIAFADKGEIELKNIARPVHVFSIRRHKSHGAGSCPCPP